MHAGPGSSWPRPPEAGGPPRTPGPVRLSPGDLRALLAPPARGRVTSAHS